MNFAIIVCCHIPQYLPNEGGIKGGRDQSFLIHKTYMIILINIIMSWVTLMFILMSDILIIFGFDLFLTQNYTYETEEFTLTASEENMNGDTSLFDCAIM